MYDNDNHRTDAGPEEDVVGQLLHLAGPRPAVPEDVLVGVRSVAHAAWRAKVEAHKARKRSFQRSWQLAAAALVVLAAGASFLWRQPAPDSARWTAVATVVALQGEARLLPEGREAGAENLEPGAPIPSGATLATGDDGRLALRLASGVSVRLDHGSRLELQDTHVLALERGAVYLDSGETPSALEVRTPMGVARDVGTQFEVRLADHRLHLQVREGAVELEHAGITHAAPAGTRLTLAADGTLERGATPGHGAGWDWILAVSPDFELEGRTVAELLEWAANETGLDLVYAAPEAAQKAAASIGHGSVAGLGPLEMLEVVLPGSGLAYRIAGGRLVVALADR